MGAFMGKRCTANFCEVETFFISVHSEAIKNTHSDLFFCFFSVFLCVQYWIQIIV